ncbi:MAG: Cna domain protein, partial [Phycisphaerales bacterium]|nr:Cna domain protein [Phycisphaerales bacterium]
MLIWAEPLERRALLSAAVWPAPKHRPARIATVLRPLSPATTRANVVTAGTIRGTIINDLNANGISDSGENLAVPRASLLRVYLDANNDGIRQAEEVAVSPQSINDFSFANVPAGTYVVRLDTAPAAAARLFQTGPAGNAFQVTVTAGGTTMLPGYFAVQQRAVVSGKVVHDLNGNGTVDSGETGAAGDVVFVDANYNSTL